MIVFAQEWSETAKTEAATLKDLEVIFRLILNIVVRLAGVAVFIFLIIGGFQYLTAGGDPKKSESAKNTITYAILGLGLLILAWFILRFIEIFTGIDVTIFKIGQ